jgi:hypothetical protein
MFGCLNESSNLKLEVDDFKFQMKFEIENKLQCLGNASLPGVDFSPVTNHQSLRRDSTDLFKRWHAQTAKTVRTKK